MYKVTIKDKNDNIIIIINGVHHVTHEPIKSYTYLWKDSEEISRNYLGLIDNQFSHIYIEKEV